MKDEDKTRQAEKTNCSCGAFTQYLTVSIYVCRPQFLLKEENKNFASVIIIAATSHLNVNICHFGALAEMTHMSEQH